MFNLRLTSRASLAQILGLLERAVLLALLAWLAPAVDVHLPAAVSRRVSTGKNARSRERVYSDKRTAISGER